MKVILVFIIIGINGYMKVNRVALVVSSLLVSSFAWSHGFVMEPPSRGLLCKNISQIVPGYAGELNKNCGNIQYEPQSLEAPKGYPASGPKDGQIGSANQTRGSELDDVGINRWVKTDISAGKHQFHWYFTAPHPTAKYEYFITKNNWNPDQPLTRASFEAKPFCTIPVDGSRPGAGASVVHTCDVPEREGYQEILAVWTVHDTSNAFYNILDVEFAGHNSGGGDNGVTPPDNGDDNEGTPPDNGGDNVHSAPVIHLLQNHIVVQKKPYNESYTINASATTGADNFKWEVVEGFGNFQLQEKSGAPTHGKLEGKNFNTVRAWIKAGVTGKAKYRLTASNRHGQAVKYITVEVKDDDNGGAQQPSSADFTPGKVYVVGDTVNYKGHVYRCLNGHTGAAHWNPAEAHSLWRKIK